jgi:hypothetical protein
MESGGISRERTKHNDAYEASVKALGRRAGGRTRCLAIGSLILTLLVGCSLSTGTTQNAPSRAARNPNGLTWAPPQCGDAEHGCVDLYLRNTGSHQRPMLNDNADYRIHLPASSPLVGGIAITGGRRVQIIGGEIDLPYPCSNDGSECMGIYIVKSSPGAVFVEGVWIHNPARIGRTCPGGASDRSQTCSSGDGIDVNTANNGVINVNTITLENIRVDGISGCSGHGHGDHADVFQPYQAPDDTIRIDRMTGVTNCQGLELDPELAYSVWHTFPASITVQNVNIDLTFNPYRQILEGYTWILTYRLGCKSGPIFLNGDYSGGPQSDPAAARVWPDPDNGVCGARYSNGAFSWTEPAIHGTIRGAAPPGGDFVPPGAVGLDYRSPGYRR